MNWLQFIAAIIRHLAWPLVIIVLFVMLRKQLGALADRLLEFSFGGAKMTFDKILQRGAEIIEQAAIMHGVQGYGTCAYRHDGCHQWTVRNMRSANGPIPMMIAPSVTNSGAGATC